MSITSLLLLSDGRFPAGGHAHSLATEGAVEHGLMSDEKSLRAFLNSRLITTGLVEATFCAHAAAKTSGSAELLDVEYEARTLSSKTRRVSRQLGRQLIDTAVGMWPDVMDGNQLGIHSKSPDETNVRSCPIGRYGWHHPVAFGLVAHLLSISPTEAAAAVLYQFMMTITTAVVRLIGLDPVIAP